MSPDYRADAARYDSTRGGEQRAASAVAAILELVPRPGTVLDVGGGTGIISAQLAASSQQVAVVDRVIEMLRLAHARLPGAVACMDGTRLAMADASVDTVTMIWLLHLLPNAEPLIAEAARVLRPGGHLVTTVDKAAASGTVQRHPTDALDLITAIAAKHELDQEGTTSFVGVGQRGSPVYPLVCFRRRSPRALDAAEFRGL